MSAVLKPGPSKKFDRYFTTPITQIIHEQLEVVKWRTHIEKTEIMRRLFEYFLMLPPDSQDKILRSFDGVREQQKSKTRKVRKKDVLAMVAHPKLSLPPMPTEAAPIQRIVKRSGLP